MFILARAFALLAIVFLFSSPNHADAATHTIRGRVTSYVTGLPIADVYVQAHGGTFSFGYTHTSEDGSYALTADVDSPPSGTGTVEAWTQGYVPVRASFDPTRTDITMDFVMHSYGIVSGTIRRAGSGEPIPGMSPRAFYFNGTAWSPQSGERSDSAGNFRLALGPGTYRVCAGGIGTSFARQCFDGLDIHSTNDLAAAAPIVVTDGASVSGIPLRFSEGNRIRGTVREKRTLSPIVWNQLFIELYDVNGTLLEETDVMSDESGAYEITGVPEGTFYMTVKILSGAITGKWLYSDIRCPSGICPAATSGRPIIVSRNSAVEGIDFLLTPAAILSGAVTDRSTGQPLGGVKVVACVLPIIFWGDCYLGISNAVDGRYEINLDNKRYMVYAEAPDSHVNQIYPDTACLDVFCQRSDAFSFVANEGDLLSGYDFALRRSSRISGTVLHSLTGEPLSGATVAVFDANYKFLWSIWPTDESGSYLTAKWPGGTYYLAAYYSWSSSCGFYLDRPCPLSATDQAAIAAVNPTPVVVADGELREGIDIRFLPDRIFASYFDEGAYEKQPADAIH